MDLRITGFVVLYMTKTLLVALILLISACGGTLTEEQRKKMREGSEQQAVVKVTDAELTEAAFEKGRAALQGLTSPDKADSLASALNVKIHWLQAGASPNTLALEQQILDAYINSVITGAPMRDNIQKIGTDSMLYTSVVVLTRPDSSIEIKGTWNIWMSKKQLILSMGKK
jgi:hypothetical protein